MKAIQAEIQRKKEEALTASLEANPAPLRAKDVKEAAPSHLPSSWVECLRHAFSEAHHCSQNETLSPAARAHFRHIADLLWRAAGVEEVSK